MTSESTVQSNSRLMIANLGGFPQRNNVGVAIDHRGIPVRYGLMNESEKQNRKFKSSDLISPIPTLITQEMVGQIIGIYGAFECKHSDWHLTPGDDHGQAQLRYHELIRSVGGYAGFVTNPTDILKITGRMR